MPLLRVPGVGDVTARTDQFSMRIWMNPDKMASYSLTPTDVVNALNAQNVYVAAGAAGAPPQNTSQTHEIGILVNGMLSKAEDYRKIIVKTIPTTGELVYLKDVARVELGKFTFSSNAFVDGNRCSLLMIYQSPGSNALQTADNVYAALAQLKKSFPSDVDYIVSFESVTIIRVSMQEVMGTLLKALGFGCYRCIPVPAKLAFYHHTYIGYPGLYIRHFLFLYPPGFHDKYAHHVWLCAGYWYSG